MNTHVSIPVLHGGERKQQTIKTKRIMNKDLLKQLYKLHSPSGSERKMRKFLKRQARACGATDIQQDVFGNLFITKGTADTYPCVAAHMDQVQNVHARDFVCIEDKGVIFGYSPKCHEQQGLGADDKNGILICLECLARYDAIKVAFFVGEETGCVGSSHCDLTFFTDCRFIIEPDRRGSSDLITSMFCGQVCSADFMEAIGYEAYGYKPTQGSITDVGELTQRRVGISCLNLSCGYYEAHTDREFTVVSELENCLDFVCHIIDICTDVYPFSQKKEYMFYGYRSLYEFEDEAYSLFDSVLSYHPEATLEECMLYLDDETRTHLTDEQIRTIYDDAKMWYKDSCADF